MELQTASIPRLSVILHARPQIADLVGMALPTIGTISRKAETERAVASVLRELNGVFDPIGTELIVVDAESPEGIADHLKAVFSEECSRRRLQIVTCPASFDAARLRNLAAQKAQGAWLSFLSPGECFQSGRLTRLDPLLKGYHLILGLNAPSVPARADWISSFLSNQIPPTQLVPGAALIHRSLFEEVGGYLEGRYALLIDYDLWLRALLRLRETGRLERFLLVPTQGIEPSTREARQPWIREGQEVLTVLSTLPKIPLRFWPTALKRAASYLLNR